MADDAATAVAAGRDALSPWRQGELETSISSYYGGPVLDVFVGVLFATAACMVAYRGASLLEDYALNAARFYAVFVALVPNSLEEIIAQVRWYRLILLLMTVGGIAVVAITLVLAREPVIIFLEWWEILLFCVFWVIQTRRVGALLRERGDDGARTGAV